MSKKASFADIAVNIVLAITAAAAAALFCIYLIGGGAPEEITDDVTPPLVIEASETVSVSETVTETEAVSDTEAELETTAAPRTEEASASESAETMPPPPSDYDSTFFDSAFFIGDSISVGLMGYEFIKPENIFAQAGITPSSVTSTKIGEMTVYQKVSGFNPKYICIMLGTNGLSYQETDVMTEKLDAFIDELKKLCPDAKITLSSIPPITRKHEAEKPEKLSTIVEYNSKLKKLAEDKSVAFVDVYTLLKDESGYFRSDYAEQDGLHLKKRAYPVILCAIQTAINEFYGKQPVPSETAVQTTAAVVTEPLAPSETAAAVSESVSAAPEAAETAVTSPVSETAAPSSISEVADSSYVSEAVSSSSENGETTVTDEIIEEIEVLE